MVRLLIKNGRIIDPANNLDNVGSICIADGHIVAVGYEVADFNADQVIDAQNLIVCPGFIDLSTRLREPGQTRKATITSELAAAAAAGVTTLCLQPDTIPAVDSPAVAELIKEQAKKTGYQGLLPIAALTQKLEGTELSAMLSLKQAGCIAVSNANQPVKNLLVLRRAMEYAASHDLLLIYRPNEYALSHNGCIHEGKLSTRYGLPSIPYAAETVALAQCLELAELTGCRVHFGQLSSSRSVTMLRQTKQFGLSVTADVSIQQLHLTEDDVIPFDSAFHVLPPFRTKADQQALRKGIASGVIDNICSDHQPHDLDAKLGAFPETEPGISSLETLLPLMLKLVKDNVISLSQGVAALTQNPAKILQIDRGALMPGKVADICIFDPIQAWQVNADNWRSQGLNTPFWGQMLTGQVTYTLQAGKVIHCLFQQE